MEWQPIETAPKDETWILAIRAGREIPFVTAWDDEDDEWFTLNLCYENAVKPGRPSQKWKPTHWMPLPEPPR